MRHLPHTPWFRVADVDAALDFYRQLRRRRSAARAGKSRTRCLLVCLPTVGTRRGTDARRAPFDSPGLGSDLFRRQEFRPSRYEVIDIKLHRELMDKVTHHQPPTARWLYGVHQISRRHPSNCCKGNARGKKAEPWASNAEWESW